MEEKKSLVTKESKLVLMNRKNLSMSGVEKVISIKPNYIELIVCGDKIIIEGENLDTSKLDVGSGVVEISGSVNGIKFSYASEKIPFLKRVFK